MRTEELEKPLGLPGKIFLILGCIALGIGFLVAIACVTGIIHT